MVAGETNKGTGLALSGLLVGCVAFLIGFVPVLGFLVGVTAVILCVVAVVKKQSRGMSITGLVLGGIAAVTSIIVGFVVIIGAITSGSVSSGFNDGVNAAQSQESESTSSSPQDTETAKPIQSLTPNIEIKWFDSSFGIMYDENATWKNCDAGQCLDLKIKTTTFCTHGITIGILPANAKGSPLDSIEVASEEFFDAGDETTFSFSRPGNNAVTWLPYKIECYP